MVQPGDSIPSIDLFEGPKTKVDLSKELSSGKGVIVGVPAAFSPACSAQHVPEYINSKKLKDAGKVYIVSVNDPFVMKAWQEQLDPGSKSGVRFLADPAGELGHKLDLLFGHPPIFGDKRYKRHAIVVEDGKVKSVHIEPDNIGVKESAASNVIGA